MNRTAILAFITLIIFCAVTSQILLSSALTHAVTISASGSIIQNGSEFTFLKFINAWGLDSASSAIINHMARFDIVSIDFVLILTLPSQIKAINPNCRVIGYKDVMAMNTEMNDWNEVNQHEDWFVHDLNGKRLVNKDWGWYCMDVRSQGWRDHFADYVMYYCVNYNFDGVFADDLWTNFWRDAWTVPESSVPNIPEWHAEQNEFLEYVKSQIGVNVLLGNGPNNDYPYHCDGRFAEDFMEAWEWSYDVDSLYQISGDGRYFMAFPRMWEEFDEAAFKYTFGAFLLGVNGPYAYYGTDIWTPTQGYYPLMDYGYGSPLGDYYEQDSLYIRKFQNAIVIVNFDSSTHSTVVNGIVYTLTPYSAEIII